MDEFPGLMARDFGFRPQGKSAPMSSSKSVASGGGGAPNLATGSVRSSAPSSSRNKSRSGWNGSDSLLGGGISEDRTPPGYDDVFGVPPMYSISSSHGRSVSSSSNSPPSFDSIFDGFNSSAPKSSSLPVYDKPVYDDDIFDGVPGIKSSSFVKYDDVFGSSNHASSPPYDDLLQNIGRTMPEPKGTEDNRYWEQKDQGLSGFDELIPGFGGSSPQQREPSDTGQQSAAPSAEPIASMPEDPFVVLETTSIPTYSSSGLFTDPLEHIGRPMNSGSSKVGASPISGGVFDDNAFDELTRSAPLFTSKINDTPKDKTPLKTEKEPPQRSSTETFASVLPKSSDSLKSIGRTTVQNSDANFNAYDRNAMEDQSPKSYEDLETADDVWLTVTEIPLFTQPTSAPPPSRPLPRVSIKQAQYGKADHLSSVSLNTMRKDNGYFSQFSQNHPYVNNSVKKSDAPPIDELEDFAMGKPGRYANEHAEVFTSKEEIETNTAAAASAAAMKEAMDRAEAKFKHAREVREREHDTKSFKSRDSAKQEIDERAIPDAQDPYDREKQERLDHEREQMEKEEKETELKRREKEREQELERERARQAVERATREARERAAAEARLKAERAAVVKVNAEARQRAERAAVQRAAAEARERATAEARERAERAAAEARERAAAERAAAEARERAAAERASAEARERAAAERASAEARERSAAEARERAAVERAAAEARLRAQRAAVDRATAEARERAAAEARERAASLAREKQHRAENDLESFFGMSARANSVPKQRTTTSENVFGAQSPSKGIPDAAKRASPSSSSTIRKAPSATNFDNDLTSIFGAPPSSGDFQDVEGESEERRRARLERHQRTLERTAKALAEKNERDMQAQRDQAERHRIAEMLDVEIKRWAAGKEGNLRALLSTMQYVLWPECGWQPVSLTDLITGASVKRVYRKANLCIHPDKVQQKGASIQQKYIAEKVFDLLKEAWNKFNSEELF